MHKHCHKKYRPHQPSELRLNDQSHDSRGWMNLLGQEEWIWSAQAEELPSSLPARMPPANARMPWLVQSGNQRNQRERLWPQIQVEYDGGCENPPAEEWPEFVTSVLTESRAMYDVKWDSTLHFQRPLHHYQAVKNNHAHSPTNQPNFWFLLNPFNVDSEKTQAWKTVL